MNGEFANGHFVLKGMSWEGHEFADSIRNPEVWRRTRDAALNIGGVGIQAIFEVAKALAKQLVMEKLGIAST